MTAVTAAEAESGHAARAVGKGSGGNQSLVVFDLLSEPCGSARRRSIGKRGEGCRASPLLRRDRTVQTLAKVYEDRADEFSRAAEQTDDPVFCRLLLMLALQWKLAAQGEAKSKDAPTSLESTQPQP